MKTRSCHEDQPHRLKDPAQASALPHYPGVVSSTAEGYEGAGDGHGKNCAHLRVGKAGEAGAARITFQIC